MKLTLEVGQSIQITGPAKLHVIEGQLTLLGGSISSEDEVIIQAGKQYPFEVEEKAEIELIGDNLKYTIVNSPLIPLDRKKLAQKIEIDPYPVKIMVLGQVDTGKSTVVCYLANYFSKLGKKVAVIDLDPGQQNIGPPSTITLGLLKQLILKLGDIPLLRMVFIGKTSPQGRMLQMVSGARELVDHALAVADVILIDTTGWVFGGAARALKTSKIHALTPHFLVALQNSNEIEHIIKPFEFSEIKTEMLSVFQQIETRSHETRKFLRESAFNNYFKNATSCLLNLESLRTENTFFHTGQILNATDLKLVEQTLECDFMYAEKAADVLFFVKRPSAFYNKENLNRLKLSLGVQEVRIVNKNDEQGLLVGLLDKDLQTLGIGIIENIHYRENKIRIYTPVLEKIRIIQFGYLRITTTGQEISEPEYFF